MQAPVRRADSSGADGRVPGLPALFCPGGGHAERGLPSGVWVAFPGANSVDELRETLTLVVYVRMAMTVPHATRPQATHWPPRGPARVLVVLDRPMLIELIRMTLNHGVYTTR